jgi:hypothetical protein
MTTTGSRLRAWYLITLALVPPLWSMTDWHAYTHFAGPAAAASYVALAVSPFLFVLGTRRLFRRAGADSRAEF